MGKIIGIDLGTTKSAVAIYENDQPKIYENSLGKRTTPSYVALKKTKDKKTGEVSEEWIVGENAKRQTALNPLNTLYGVKRLIGRRFDDPEVQKMESLASYKIVPGPNGDAWVEVDGKAMAPVEISAKVLRELKESVEKQLGEEVTEAVITVPAYFNDAQRKATRDAGKIAGLDVKRIINEPTAAALAYGMDKKKGGKIAVYDLGGGTFDVSILEVSIDEEGSLIRVLATNGDTFLGGENFDERIMAHLVSELNSEHGTNIDVTDKASKAQFAQQIQRIRDASEKAKIDLSREEVTTISLPFLMPDENGEMINFETTLSRKQLETMLKDLIDATLPPFQKSLDDAGLKVSDLDDVILVGAQTRMPKVVDVVRQFAGKEPRRDVTPDEIVAMGAAVQGAILQGHVEDVLLLDVIPLSIGIRTAGDVMDVAIPRNSTIPTEFKDVYTTAVDNQRNVEIKIYQGERAKASENKLLGKFVLDGIPPAKKQEPQIELALNIDADGVLIVSAKDLKTGREQKIKVEANGGLSDDDVAQMLKDAEANAEKDRLFKLSATADANADYELKEAAKDTEEEYFTSAPAELKKKFEEAVKGLSDARLKKDVDAMLAKTEELKNVRMAIGEAFNAQSAPATETEATPAATPEAKPETKAEAPKGEKPEVKPETAVKPEQAAPKKPQTPKTGGPAA
ncbi:MAG: molecular chaperone DnaK [Alphaproteobacteria bacterium]|nr:molecular chaperone DnaK [Alphaproteobacteria bacterium]